MCGSVLSRIFYSLLPSDAIRWVNISSGNGLLPDGITPLPEPMLTNHQRGFCSIHLRPIHRKCPRYQFVKWVWKVHLLYPPLQWSWKGGILVSPCPSVRLWTESCPLCIFNNTCWIRFKFAHLIKQLQKVMFVSKFRMLKFWRIFFKFGTLTLSSFDLGSNMTQ